MPELPEVELVRRQLEPVLRKARIVRVILRRPDLRVPFPRRFAARLAGQEVRSVDRRAKYLLLPLSSGETLIVHLGMSGSFSIADDPGETARWDRHDHVIFQLSPRAAVVFNDPRRFGFMDVIPSSEVAAHPTLGSLGPEPLSAEFDAAALARACVGKKVTLKVALLDQRIVAGLGNIYASEALHLARLSPRRRASTIATRAGAPRDTAVALVEAIKVVLARAIDRAGDASYRDGRFRVYDREGARCLRRGCSGTIRRVTQAGRSTFYCAVCQR